VQAPRFPYQDPVRCRHCGYVTERWQLRDETHQKLSLAGIRHVAPGDCLPDEYVTVCPVCQAEDPFDDATRCAECDQYPCTCAIECGAG